jgi:hypothetical protein
MAGYFRLSRRTRLMLPRGRGCIFCTGATASLCVRRRGLCCFASAKFGLSAVAHAAAREL